MLFSAPANTDFIVRKAPLPTETFIGICEDYIPKAITQTKDIANRFDAESDTLVFDLWRWSRQTFRYEEDRPGYEEIRLPRRSWKDRKSGIDCEDFVILLSGILHNLAVNHTIRMTDYGDGWQHIYIKVGRLTLDPVNPEFNEEPEYKKRRDCDIKVDLVKKCEGHFYPYVHHLHLPEGPSLHGLENNYLNTALKWKFAQEVSNGLNNGQVYNRVRLQQLAKKEYGIEDKTVVKELTEAAYFRHASEVVHAAPNRSEAFDWLVLKYENQAISSLRTSESIMLQQYSTPLPMALLIGQFCNIDRPGISVFEPTAGNGFLTVGAGMRDMTGSLVNEIAPNRYENLLWLAKDYHFEVSKKDATETAFYNLLPQYDAVLANPPFGQMERRKFDKIVTKKMDHWVILNALGRMKDDGRAAFIIGGHTYYDSEGRIGSRDKSTGDRYFFNYLYHHYYVSDIINVNGDLYSRQGTQFDVRIILISGRKAAPDGFAPLEPQANTAVAETWTQLWKRISPHFTTQSIESNVMDVQEVKKFIGIGFDKSAGYKPEAWAKAKRIMEWLVNHTPYVERHDYGRGKGKYRDTAACVEASEDKEVNLFLAEVYSAQRPIKVPVGDKLQQRRENIAFWNAYRDRHFTTGQKVWVVEEEYLNYLKPRPRKFVQATVGEYFPEDIQPKRFATLRVWIPWHKAQTIAHRPLREVYFENPDTTPGAQSVLELYPPNDDSPTAPVQEKNHDRKKKRMAMQAKALILKLQLLSL